MSTRIEAPWTPEQVAALNEYQAEGWMHPFTCRNRGDGRHKDLGIDLGTLIATTDGWVCPDCDYRQTWAHTFMFGSAPPRLTLAAEVKEGLHDQPHP